MALRTLCASLLTGLMLAHGPIAAAQDDIPAPDADADAATEEVQATPEGTYDLEFERDLFQESPLMLNGILANRRVSFVVPPDLELDDDIELHVQLDHSKVLLPKRSSMTVLVNNRAIDSFFLDAENGVMGNVLVKIPSGIIRPDFNSITFAAIQHYTTDCEDPFDPNLWSRISNDSFLRLRAHRKTVTPDLAQWPLPFYVKNGAGPVKVSLVVPDPTDPATIEALGILGVALGRIADFRGVEIVETVASVREATGHAIMVARSSQPDAASLAGVSSADAGQGVLAFAANPSDPTLAVVVVTGDTDEAIRNAAFALAAEDRSDILSGPRTVVNTIVPGYPASRRKPTPAPRVAKYRLSDMDFDDLTVRGFYSDPVVIPMALEGDSQVRIDGGTMELHYAYSAQLDTRLSTVEVQLDGVSLVSRALDEPEGDQDAMVEVILPADLVKPNSLIKVQFHLFPKEFEACERVSDRIIWGSVKASTAFNLPRDHFAKMPDIGRLAYDLWPFTMEGDKGAVMIVAPDAPNRQDAASVFEVAATLGQRRTVGSPRFQATTAAALGGQNLPYQHMVVLHSGSQNRAYDALEGLALNDNGSGGKLLADERAVLIDANQTTTFGSIEEVQHPGASDKSILVLRSTGPETILPLAESLSDVAFLGQLTGNVAIVPEDIEEAEVRSVRRGDTRMVGTKPLNSRVTAGLANFWPAFFLLLLAAALLFALAVSLWARRHGAHT